MEIVKMEKKDKSAFMPLLLQADEDEKMIEKYLSRGELFALYDDGLKSICVVTRESDDECELKNIATDENWHGKGYGGKLLQHMAIHYKRRASHMAPKTSPKKEETAAIDLHGHTVDEAEMRLIECLEALPKTVRALEVTHGYSHGAVLKRMVREEFYHWRVKDKRVGLNAGVTWLLLK